MADDSLRLAIDAVTGRLRAELEAQLAQVGARHIGELEAARRAAEAEAEARCSAMLDEVRAEGAARLASEIAAVRAAADSRILAESQLRIDSQRDRDHLQRQLETANSEASAARQELSGLRAAWAEAQSALLEERRAREYEARVQAESAAAATEAQLAERQSQLAIVERLLSGIRALDVAPSLSRVLTTLLSCAALETPRVALFVSDGSNLKTWKAAGFGVDGTPLHADASGDGLLAEALRRGEPLTTSDTGPRPPDFAELPHGRAAIAVPLLVGANPVAVLYADDADGAQSQAPAAWPEAIQVLCRHASVTLAHLTAARAAETMRRSLTPARATPPQIAEPQAAPVENSTSARRYARLLVSEIKLYNEPAVRIGREKRDLLTRLKPEIDRAWRLYQQRISLSVDAHGALFQQELVSTLADGDPTLLGGPV